MSIVNPNGQPVTSEVPNQPAQADNPPPSQPQAQRVPLTMGDMQRIIGAYARLKQIRTATIQNPRDEAEATGLQNFLTGALLANVEELFGAWVAMHQEYSPLITGVTALFHRAFTRIDQQNAAIKAGAAEVKESPDPAT